MQSAQGIIYGKTIELTEDPGFQPGQVVSVELKAATSPPAHVWGEAIKRSAGALADMPELDTLMERIQAERKADFGRESLELQE